jgi:uncharacterized protein YprB with RNaseH-like and TPR domain
VSQFNEEIPVPGPLLQTERSIRAALGLQRRGEDIRGTGGQLESFGFMQSESFIGQRIDEVRAAFTGVRLADRYELMELAAAHGRALWLSQCCSMASPALPSIAQVRAALSDHLDLVRGIGPVKLRRLRADGVRQLSDLVERASYLEYAGDAALVLSEIDSEDWLSVSERLRSRFGGRGHLTATLLAGAVGLEEVGFLDVETLGLDNNMIFLIGVGRFRNAGFVVDQFLAPKPADEAAALSMALEALAGIRVLVTYNGSTADLPWLRNRCFYHGVGALPTVAHIDLLYGTRRRWRTEESVLSDARLPTVQEHLLGIDRPSYDVPSYMVPDLYDAYVRSPEDEGLLVPVIDHNRSDIEALCVLLGRLCEEAVIAHEAMFGV